MSINKEKEKTVGLITVMRANYGSALQTFALYTIINQLGYKCTIIDHNYPTSYHLKNAIGNEYNPSQNILNPKVFVRKSKSLIKHLIRFYLKRNFPQDKSKELLEDFLHECTLTPTCYNKDSILLTPPHFDIYLTGSDQVWNPRYCHKDYSFLLNFTHDNQKRIAYAASFGSKELFPEFKNDYSKLLSRYDFISTRERSGIRIVKELTQKDAEYCLDPTMLLTKEMWHKYSNHDTNLKNEKYILCYIQNYAFTPYPYVDKLIKRVKKLTGYKVKIITQDVYDIVKGYDVQYNVGPKEFLDLYENASFVIACSFHAIVFSLIMKKSFIAVMNNKTTNDDRQANIIKEFNLEQYAYKVNSPLPKELKELFIDYTAIDKKLEELRKSSLNHLKTALS